ncbi:LOW QUALITY PROTEIN: uncharacterized protein EMH_0053640 [Eimeria mitis]|uniref:Uncharacterized protein n=1 Tax=Eimeria mitis TaxID=44415 RepID=U6KKM5_9EIME|nr:LOW QUALITY PROTEIN: uncharacterized protein EMH_0053640 [Eimeria mitis]CDJ36008.1 hypothetical protein EMH_0053640 [Eimeria mitis]
MLQTTGEAVVAAAGAADAADAESQQHQRPRGEATATLKTHSNSLILAAAAVARCLKHRNSSAPQVRWGVLALLARLYDSAALFFSRCSGLPVAASATGTLTTEQVLVLLQCHLLLVEGCKQRQLSEGAGPAVVASFGVSMPQTAAAAAAAAATATRSPAAEQLLRDIQRVLQLQQQRRAPQLLSSYCEIFKGAFAPAVCEQSRSKFLEPPHTSLAGFRVSLNRVSSSTTPAAAE